MKKKKKKESKKQKNSFFPEENKAGIVYGVNKNLNDINKYVKPKMNEVGIEIFSARGEDEVRKPFSPADSLARSVFGKKTQKDGSGNLQKIFAINDPYHFLYSQVHVIERMSHISRIKYCIPRNVTDNTTEENRIETMLTLLKGSEFYLCIFMKTEFFLLIKYADIPPEGWNLTYTNSSAHTRLNKMYLSTDYLKKTIKHLGELKETILLNLKK
ncbi:MAG: hypothetical protein U1B79_00305, partial [Candidatus Pacearchaeota archaeon]|nr:hypothetical protein [Candidatus Pacearchaeota archaeon]